MIRPYLLKKWSINISRLPHPYSFPLYAVEMEAAAMDGCHAVEITSFGGIDGKFPLSVPKQPELKNHQINMAKSSMQSAKIIAITQRNAINTAYSVRLT